jgi:DNA topoisomerase I
MTKVPSTSELQKDLIKEAHVAGLRYTSDDQPGISRRRCKDSFAYHQANGAKARDRETLSRIKSLAIPPAWENVWISTFANGHVQATGRDARKRKQYRYHPKWREQRDESKFEHMLAFARMLPKIRRKVAADIRRKEMCREKIVATVVRLLETTVIRVGNDEYARDNHSYGLTTMCNRHVEVTRSDIVFSFRGKSGKHHEITLHDPRVARIIRTCQEMPGQVLFSYFAEEEAKHIGSSDVNDYLRQISGTDFTAKDFRTWIGTVLAATAFQEFEVVTSERQAKKNIGTVIESVAKILGNTPTVCRKCYVHPDIILAYLEGVTLDTVSRRISTNLKGSLHRLRPAEGAVLALLQRRLKSSTRNSKSLKTARGKLSNH